MNIPRMTDRMNIKIGEVVFTISPVNYFVKKEIGEASKIVGGEQTFDLGLAQYIYIKHALKSVSGLIDSDGNEYRLSFEGDTLTDECISELFYMEQREQFLTACWALLNEFSEKKVIQGVALDLVRQVKPPL